MKSLKFLIIISCLMPVYTFAMPAYPMAFWGNVTVNNLPSSVGTVISAYDASSTLLGDVTVLESGIYGYDNPLQQKLLLSDGVGYITFTFKTVGGLETAGCNTITASSFVAGVTEQKNLAFKTFGCGTVPDSNGNATLSSSTNQVVITGGTTTSITVGIGTVNPTIDVSSFISNGIGTLPAINIVSTNANNVTVSIPASTIVSSVSTKWNGIIAVPTVTTVTLPVESGQTKILSTAIEVGLPDTKLTFSKSVRILLPNQAGKRVGYTRTGSSFTEITNLCVSLNDQVAIDNDLVGSKEECKIDSGLDKIIWTKHLTIFATYVQTPVVVVSGGGGTGGGGGGGNIYVAPVQVVVSTSTATSSQLVVTTSTSVPVDTGCIKDAIFSVTTGKKCVVVSLTVPVDIGCIKDAIFSITTGKKCAVVVVATQIRGSVLGATAFNFSKNLRVGSRGNDVKELQKILIAEGLLDSEATGFFGAMTKVSLVKWQAKNNLPATGFFGPMTRGLFQKSSQ